MFLVLNFDARASGRFALDLDFLLAPVDRFGGPLGVLGSRVSGRGYYRVARFQR